MSQNNAFDVSNRVYALALLFSVGIFTYGGAFAWSQIFGASSGNYPQQITVEGTGEVEVAPDLAEIYLGVSGKGATAQEASQKSTETMNAILAVLKEKGLTDTDIKTDNYTMGPNLEWNGSEYKENGFVTSQNLNIKVHDLTKVGEILTAATNAGATNVGGVSFTLEDEEAAIQEARVEAIQKARAKAESIEKESGMNLGRVIGYYEYSNTPMPYGKGGVMMEGAAMDSVSAEPQIQPGTTTVTLTASFTYRVR